MELVTRPEEFIKLFVTTETELCFQGLKPLQFKIMQ